MHTLISTLSGIFVSSWHGTSPIFAADYQPWTAAQLRKVLPFPTGSVSTEGSSPGLQATTPGTPSRKPDRSQAEPNSPARPLTGTNQPLSGTVKAMANESSGSTGGYNAGAARVYRLATGGADSCVRVSQVVLQCGRSAYFSTADLDCTSECRGRIES
jgi:hypothetical protein